MIASHPKGVIRPNALDHGGNTEMAKMLTPKEIAPEFGTTAKTLRKFLRKDEKAVAAQGGETPGKGGRWAIPASSVKSLQKRFDAWVAANAAKAKESDETPEGEDDAESVIPTGTTLDDVIAALDEMPLEGDAEGDNA